MKPERMWMIPEYDIRFTVFVRNIRTPQTRIKDILGSKYVHFLLKILSLKSSRVETHAVLLTSWKWPPTRGQILRNMICRPLAILQKVQWAPCASFKTLIKVAWFYCIHCVSVNVFPMKTYSVSSLCYSYSQIITVTLDFPSFVFVSSTSFWCFRALSPPISNK